jgi:hypothetical protein
VSKEEGEIMGMYGHLRQITPEELDQLRRDPDTLEQFLFGEVEANAPKIRAALERVQDIARKAEERGRTNDSAEIEKTRALILKELMGTGVHAHGAPIEEGLSLEKYWHALHYLLTGKTEGAPPPLGNAILGGEEIGEERDYGRIRFLTPQQVRKVSEALASISRKDLAGRFNVQRMKASNVIYPCRNQEELNFALDYFEQLVNYYSDAASRGNAVLLYVE